MYLSADVRCVIINEELSDQIWNKTLEL